MISLDEARGHVKLHLPDPVVETTALGEALGRVLVEDIVATEPVPPFANSAMDGFALVAADTVGASAEAPRRLPIVGTIAAGSPPEPAIGPGQAVRIMTGAPLPPGADAVVMVELTQAVHGGPQVDVGAEVEAGNAVRAAGGDVAVGDVVVRAGTVLRPAHLGVLANVGVREVATYRPARVGVVSTGDELVDDGRPLGPGQIRESNRPLLLGLVAQAGCEPVDLGCVEDDNAAISEVLTRGARDCDAILSSGGVSMGDFDLVKVVLDRLGEMRWMQIAIKPAKPFAFGTIGGTPVFGLPGNPVSSLVSFELLARPALRAMAGDPAPDRPRLVAAAPDGFRRRADGKTHFVRVVVTCSERTGFEARPVGAQGSHQLTSTAEANGLAVLLDGDGVPPGGEVGVVVLDPASVLAPPSP